MRSLSASLGALLVACVLWPCSQIRGARAQALTERVFIAAGWFGMGSEEGDEDFARRLCVNERMPLALELTRCAADELFASELPMRRVYVSAYGIDRYEVSRAEHARCVKAAVCEPVAAGEGPAELELPANALSWHEAKRLCAFKGGRLPTEAEWERSARGDSRRTFPWGRFYNPALANHGAPDWQGPATAGEPSAEDGYFGLAPVRAFAQSHSPHGLVQSAGNVWEWTHDSYALPAQQGTRIDPMTEKDGELRVVRGGSFRSPAFTLRVAYREARPASASSTDVGVRCAYDVR